MTVGTYIKQRRISMGLTQKQLSDKLGYSTPQFVSMMERDEAMVPWAVIVKLKKYIRADGEFLENSVLDNKINQFKKRKSVRN
jgi:transcriptional regulator with XRE-family HTH domain